MLHSGLTTSHPSWCELQIVYRGPWWDIQWGYRPKFLPNVNGGGDGSDLSPCADSEKQFRGGPTSDNVFMRGVGGRGSN